MSLEEMNPPIYLNFHPSIYPSSIHPFLYPHPLHPPFFPPSLSLCLLPVCLCSLVFIPSACSVSESIHLKSWVSEESTVRLNGPRIMPKTRCLKKSFWLFPLSLSPCLCLFLCGLQFSFFLSFFFSFFLFYTTLWLFPRWWKARGESRRWKAAARIRDEETELKMI